MSEVEKFIRFNKTVEDLAQAWDFVMSYVDQVGPSPSVKIEPFWHYVDGAPSVRKFHASVFGVVEGGPDARSDRTTT